MLDIEVAGQFLRHCGVSTSHKEGGNPRDGGVINAALLLYPISQPLGRPTDDGRETVTRRVYHYPQPQCTARYCYCACRDWEERKRGGIYKATTGE